MAQGEPMADGDGRDEPLGGGMGLSALGISLIYLLFGTTALVLFDVVVPRFVTSHSLLHRIQTVKAGVEVAATALLVYVLVARSRRSLSRTNEQLRDTRTRMTVLYRVLRHNLRTELTLIRGYAERGRSGSTDPAVKETCADAVAVADEVSRRVNKIHTFREVVQQEATRTDVPLADVVERAVVRVDARIDHDGAISAADVPGLYVRAVPEIEHAIAEVIENAILHHDGDAPIVDVVADREGSTVELEIRDDGPGIPGQEVAIVGGGRNETSLDHASGIGLWLADWTVTESGGTMTIADRDPRGTIVRLSLPAAGG